MFARLGSQSAIRLFSFSAPQPFTYSAIQGFNDSAIQFVGYSSSARTLTLGNPLLSTSVVITIGAQHT